MTANEDERRRPVKERYGDLADRGWSVFLSAYTRHMKTLRLTHAQLNLILLLLQYHHGPGEYGSVSQESLAEQMAGVDRTQISRLVASLRRNGYVAVQHDQRFGRWVRTRSGTSYRTTYRHSLEPLIAVVSVLEGRRLDSVALIAAGRRRMQAFCGTVAHSGWLWSPGLTSQFVEVHSSPACGIASAASEPPAYTDEYDWFRNRAFEGSTQSDVLRAHGYLCELATHIDVSDVTGHAAGCDCGSCIHEQRAALGFRGDELSEALYRLAAAA